MKKLLIILIAGLSFNAVSAQSRNDHRDGQSKNKWDQSGQHQSKDYGYNNRQDRNMDYDRQVAYDRMNRDYDERINSYRNDRWLSGRERDRRINQAEQERQQQARSFGNGLVVGGVAAILLGVLIAHK